MTVSSLLTSLMDKARASYHTTGKLSIADLTNLISQPGISSPLSITYQDWTSASGWGTPINVIVPVFKNVPICATVEIKDIASAVSGQGPCLQCSFLDKDLHELSPWDLDANGNYKKLAERANGLMGTGDRFSNKDGLRSSQRVFSADSIRNVAYLRVSVGNNVVTSYSFRNVVVSYYKPYKVEQM